MYPKYKFVNIVEIGNSRIIILYNVDEITIIIKFLDMIEECYTQGVDLADYKECYKEFKSIVRSKSEENNLYRDFKEITGYDGYQTTKEMKSEKTRIKL